MLLTYQREPVKISKKSILALTVLASVLTAQVHAAQISSESDPSLLNAALVDFEAGPSGRWISQSFGPLTVTALNSTYAPAASFSVASDYAGNYNTRGNLHISNHGNEFQSLRFDFNAPTTAFGFLFGASDSSWNLNAYSAGGAMLQSSVIAPTQSSNSGNYFGFSGLSNASYALLTQNNSASGVDYVFVDNFRVAAVPEPETFALMLASLGLLGAVVRRRKTA